MELLELKHEAEMEDKLKGLQDGQTFVQTLGTGLPMEGLCLRRTGVTSPNQKR